MMKVRSKFTGGAEIARRLLELPPEVSRRVLQGASRKAGNVIRDAARARAPVSEYPEHRQGHLRDNIIVSVLTRHAMKVVMAIHTGRAFWGNFLEFGTARMPPQPFMRPALDETADKALAVLGRELGKGVEREAAKLAKGAK